MTFSEYRHKNGERYRNQSTNHSTDTAQRLWPAHGSPVESNTDQPEAEPDDWQNAKYQAQDGNELVNE